MKGRKRTRVVVPAALLMAVAPAGAARAARVVSWDPSAAAGIQGGTGSWNTSAASWDLDGVRVQWLNNGQDTAVFAGSAGGSVALTSSITAAAVRFDVAGYALNSATSTLTLAGGSAVAHADATIGVTTIAPGGLTKSGGGVLTLSGANTIGGPIQVLGGTLSFAGEQNLGSTQNDVRLAGGALRYAGGNDLTLAAGRALTVDAAGGGIETPGGTLLLAATGQLAGAGALAKRGDGMLRITAPNAGFTGAVEVAAGTLALAHAAAINARPVILAGGTLALRATAATDFGSALAVTADSRVEVDRPTLAPAGTPLSLGDLTVNPGATLTVVGSNRSTLQVDALNLGGGLRVVNGAVAVVGPMSGTGAVTFGRMSYAPETLSSGLIFGGGGVQTVSNALAVEAVEGGRGVVVVRSGGVVDFGGAWQGGGGTAVGNFVVLREGAKFVAGAAARLNMLTPDRVGVRPFTVVGGGGGEVFELAAGFAADHTQGGAAADGFAALEVRDATLVTRATAGLPVVTKADGFGGTHRAGAVALAGTAGASWVVTGAAQQFDGRISVADAATIRADQDLLHVGVTSQKFDGQFEIPGAHALTKTGGGRLTLAGAQGYAPGSAMVVREGSVRFESDPGGGWYAGRFARGANGDVAAAPEPAGTLAVRVGGTAGAGVEFAAPVSRVASLQVDAGGTARVAAGLLVTGALTMNGGRLELEAGGAMATGSPLASVAQQVALGSITGAGVEPGMAVGFGTAADVLGVGGSATGAFAGAIVPADSVLIRWTVVGDADLDGAVTFGDFQRLERRFGKSGWWSDGDFNADGAVTHADFMLLYAHFGESVAPVAGAAGASVPEPGLGGAAAMAGLLCAPRRRRCGSSGDRRTA